MSCTGNWVCFTCRLTQSRPTYRRVTYEQPETIGMEGHVTCSKCNEYMKFLGPSISVPQKNKDNEWKALEAEVLKFRINLQELNHKEKIKRKHNLEKEIQELKQREKNKDRTRKISKLEEQLKNLTKRLT